ncbi:branched chain amino acid aminotransferase [Haloferula helveola]|uniref:branched-chain-amino-acid transaminase n=1 Tax=Haloferula helveola TaxID=490095 RepID=A0ABN6GZQ6_9BACT|nr:branched chain amino acid aminotransferase [Haloferula helveola]
MLQTYDERNRDLKVFINGALVHRDEAGVSPFDSAVQNGDAVWEGLRLYNGRIFRLHQHLDRLYRSAEMLRYEGLPEREEVIEALRQTLVANGMKDGVHVRLTISRGIKYTSGLDPRINTQGCSLFILAEFKPPVYSDQGVRLVTVSQRRPFADVLDQTIHSCNQLTSILAKMQATDAGADDALMLDTRGNLAETNATHLFLVRNGTVITPTTKACPTGITRATLLELCEANDIPSEVRDIPEKEVHEADEVFCTGTMGEVVPVTRIDDTNFHDGQAGPLTSRLAQLYRDLTRTEGDLLV